MRKIIAGLALLFVFTTAFAQSTNGAAKLKEIEDFWSQEARNAKTSAEEKVVAARVVAKAREMIKGLDINSIQPADAYSWAQVFRYAHEYKDTCAL